MQDQGHPAALQPAAGVRELGPLCGPSALGLTGMQLQLLSEARGCQSLHMPCLRGAAACMTGTCLHVQLPHA